MANTWCSDVVVVGAGPTGLTVACGLRAGGVAVRVLDRADGPAVTSRALGLLPRGTEVLDRLGALGDLPSRSLPIRQVVVRVNGRELGTLAVGRPTPLVRRPGLLVSQSEIEGALRHRLGELGGEVEWQRELVDVDQDADGVRVRLADGAVVRAGWLVGCDGAHSQVRKTAGIGFPGVRLVEQFLLADVRAKLPLARDTVAVWLRGEAMLGAFPLPGADLWRLMAPAPPDTAEHPDAEEVLSRLTELLAEQAGFPPTVVGGVQWTSVFRIHRRLAQTYRRGRILLAGDAAHIHSPFGGQGMNTSIGDAENLAWKLALVARGRAGQPLLDSYQAERRPIATEVLSSTSSITRLVLGEHAVARLVRDRVFVPLLNRPLIQRLMWDQASQLRISYRGGPLAARHPLRRGVQPGDRVPDTECLREDGTRTRLHAELGGRWAVLAAPSTLAQDCVRTARRWLGANVVILLAPVGPATRDALLVRPDAHLAWRGRAGVEQWLAGALDRDDVTNRDGVTAPVPDGERSALTP